MKVDFIHIGFHKTASTFLQRIIFPSITDLTVVNHIAADVDNWFYNNFVGCSAHQFNKTEFESQFWARVGIVDGGVSRPKKIVAISEENLSGDIYSGLESRELMFRIHETFGPTCIFVVIRNQLDFLLSAFSNYVIHGGSKSIANWLSGEETRFGRILNKIKYTSQISDYRNLFGNDRVFVIEYEKLFSIKEGLPSFLDEFELEIPISINNRLNKGRSLLSNKILSLANKLGMSSLRGRQRVAEIIDFGQDDRAYLKSLLGSAVEDFHRDNKKLEHLLQISLHPDYFS